MRAKSISFEYDPEVDAAYLRLKAGRVIESQEVQPGLILDFDRDDHILGVEILRFTRRFRPKPRSRRAHTSRA